MDYWLVCWRITWGVKVTDVLLAVGAAWQAFSNSAVAMVIGRAVVGLGVGVGRLIVPLYISELSPPSHRGRIVIINALFITFGPLIAYAWVSSYLHPCFLEKPAGGTCSGVASRLTGHPNDIHP